jgi:hypothetical protein
MEDEKLGRAGIVATQVLCGAAVVAGLKTVPALWNLHLITQPVQTLQIALVFCFLFVPLFSCPVFEKFQYPPWLRFESKDYECADLFSRFLCLVVCRNESGKINSASGAQELIMYVSIALCRRLLHLQ